MTPVSPTGERPDELERVIRPIVEGQLRSLVNDHPRILDAVDWFKPRHDKAQTFVNSAAKRIISDLLCSETRMRLISALGGPTTAETERGGSGRITGADGEPVGFSGLARRRTLTAPDAADLEFIPGSVANPPSDSLEGG